MGMCQSCNNSHHSKTNKNQQNQSQQPKDPIQHPSNQNNQKIQKTQIGKSNTYDSSSVIETQPNKQFNNPTDSLLHPDDQQDNIHRLATPSIIIKKHLQKKGNEQKRQAQDQSSNRMQNVQSLMNNGNVWQGEMMQNKQYSKISISNKCLDIQFVLPKGRAGPVVVPYIDYEQYFIC